VISERVNTRHIPPKTTCLWAFELRDLASMQIQALASVSRSKGSGQADDSLGAGDLKFGYWNFAVNQHLDGQDNRRASNRM
jgi:hypothetical protein